MTHTHTATVTQTHTEQNHPHRKTNGFLLTPVVVVAVPPLALCVVCLIYDPVFVVAQIFITKDTGAKNASTKTCCSLNNSGITQCTKLIYAINPGLST